MKYYKHPETGEVFAYEAEQDRQEWGAPELVEMTPEEIDAHLHPPIPADVRRKAAKDSIDLAAGKARDAFVSPGQYVAEEYRLAKQQADEWIAAGKPANDVPPAVAVWAQARGWRLLTTPTLPSWPRRTSLSWRLLRSRRHEDRFLQGHSPRPARHIQCSGALVDPWPVQPL